MFLKFNKFKPICFIILEKFSLLNKNILLQRKSQKEMEIFNAIFENKIDKFLSIESGINPKYPPDSLIKLLRQKSQCKYLKKKLSSKTKNIFKIFKRLSICSLLLIYSNRFYDFVGELPLIRIQNIWVDKQFIEPYHMFLKKICYSYEMYEHVKKQTPMNNDKNLEMLFYNIGLLKLLFKIVNKMALLGRYYKSKNQQIVTNFIVTLALHAQKIYVSFRQILGQMIDNPKIYIPTRNDQNMMKVVLKDQLPWINEEIKKLFLDKYFYPLGKGIGIKLFKPEELTAQSQKIIRGIVSNHEQTDRVQRKNNLEITLFPGPGKVNIRFYQQTLLSHMAIDVQTKDLQGEVVDLDDIDVDYVNSVNISMSLKYEEEAIYQKSKENQIQTGIQRYEEICIDF